MTAPPIAPGDKVGTYEIVSRLGSGGMGEVWLARHATLGSDVAIKLLHAKVASDAAMIARFFDEARASSRIHNPGIVHIYDFGWHGAAAYIVMEHLVGESLRMRLERVQRLPWNLAVRLATQTALTMAVAHAAGIVHRDLKPDNLFVISDLAVPGGERIKVLDFGIAKLLADDLGASRTQSGAILGTPMYMSPEQCRGAGVDHRTDVYALGGVLFHLICGRPPFLGDSSAELLAAHLMEEPPVASELATLPAALDAVIARALAKSIEERYASMGDFAVALGEAAGLPLEVQVPAPASTGKLARATSQPVAHAPTVQGSDLGFAPTLATGAGEVTSVPRRRPWVPIMIGCALAAGAVAFVVGKSPRDNRPVSQPMATRLPDAAIDAAPPNDSLPRDAQTIDAPPIDARPHTRDAGRPVRVRDAGVDYGTREPLKPR